MVTREAGGGRAVTTGVGPAGRWMARSAAAIVGALLGMAVGHGLAWQATAELPGDAEARRIAAPFLAGLPGELSRRDGGWAVHPAGVRGILLGSTEYRDSVISIRVPTEPDAPITRYAYAEQVARVLREAGWQVRLDPAYPIVRAARSGLVVRSGPILAEPSPPAEPGQASPEQAVLGMAVDIRRDAPAREPLALGLGALLGAALALGVVAAGRRRFRDGPAVPRRVLGLFGAGLGALAPGSLATLGLLYLNVTDDLPHEPLWIAYSLPVTRPLALVGVALLATALTMAVLPARCRQR